MTLETETPRSLAVNAGSAKARRIRAALEELREKRDSCGLHKLTFAPNAHKLTDEQRDQMEADLQYHFRLWWDTWIKPQLNAIEAELPNDSDQRTGRADDR